MHAVAPQPVRRWAFLTAGLYVLSLASLSLPVFLAAFGLDVDTDMRDIREVFGSQVYWGIVGGLGLLQAVFLLLVPVPIARGRPVARGRWIALSIAAGLLMLLLFAAAVAVFVEALQLEPISGDRRAWQALQLGCVLWGCWAVLFASYRNAADDRSALRRVVDRLLAGSVAELLIAVPCHVYVRRREECCAGFGTFMGIATGSALMLFAFGPSVYFLFAARAERLRRGRPQVVITSAEVHARDARLFALAALVFLVAAAVWVGILENEAVAMFRIGIIGAGVTSFAGFRHAALAWRQGGLHGRPVAIGASLLAEALLVALWWILCGSWA